MLSWEKQNFYNSSGTAVICGCDEAGRGPLAGPVFAAAVILPENLIIEGLDDSKKLTSAARERLYEKIRGQATAFAIASAEVHEIESLNILNASLLAMKRAVNLLSIKPHIALIDGNIARGFEIQAFPVIKGDSIMPSIAAASILAKVERDRFCEDMDELYPGYNFSKHKGYATKEHREAIINLSPCPLHRKSFLKKLMGDILE